MSLVSLLRDRARQTPNREAFTFLKDADTVVARVTYGDLDCRAQTIAAFLQTCLVPGDRVLLLYAQSLDLLEAFFGCLYAGAIAVPAPTLDAARLKRSLPRLTGIAQDAQVGCLLTTSTWLVSWQERIGEIDEASPLATIPKFATDRLANQSAAWQETVPNMAAIAYLQYTSGSTAAPKGVAIAHAQVWDNCANIARVHEYDESSKSASWTPFFHDYGLVNGLLVPIFAGIPGYWLSPLTFLKHPAIWLQVVSRYRITHSGAPNFAFEYCTRKIRPERLPDLDLSCWRVAHTGAEPVRWDTLANFAHFLQPYGFRANAFYPGYGLAEVTLMVTSRSPHGPLTFLTLDREALSRRQVLEIADATNIDDATNMRDIVVTSCGRTTGNTAIAIVDPDTCALLDEMAIGEIWVTGDSVASGYWGQDALTAATFGARPHTVATSRKTYLRTGDLGFLRHGELFVTGRLKDLMIVAGNNHYPQDIERCVQACHPALIRDAGAAFAVDRKAGEQVAIAQEVSRSFLADGDLSSLAATIRTVVATTHEIPIHAVVLLKQGSIPKTTSGKIARQACKQALLAGTLEVIWSDIRDTGKAR